MGTWSEVGLDLLFPRRCVGCGKLDAWICRTCAEQVGRGFWFEPVERDIFGLYLLDDRIMREALHGLKYNGVWEIADLLGEIFTHACSKEALFRAMGISGTTILLPIPLSRRRLAKRGYNQAETLARAVGKFLEVPVESRLLQRKDGGTLVGKGRVARQRQVMQQFTVFPEAEIQAAASYVLVDDVITTGSTLQVCRQQLLQAGASCVKGIAFGRKLR